MARQERAIRTRQAILTAAAEVFDEVGYEAATISEILQRSGLTKGALYFHFASKEELAQAVLAGQVDVLPEVPMQDLKLQFLIDNGYLLAHMLTVEPVLRGSVRLAVEQGRDSIDRKIPYMAWAEGVQAVLDEAKASGELVPSIDTARIGQLVSGAFGGVQLMSQAVTGRADILERMSDLYTCLMSAIAVPSVLVQLDFRPDRGIEVYEAAIRLREEKEQAGAAESEPSE
ncbi:TetR/AcrR family transcriptional regulator [Streptomyces bambusae]|uniref:ScbR family autoregulator-binding transcription factor n=1 Tax=Streptomyces bambusae TaxID=1550616 RepID=UPI001CFF4E2A|nr:ScbR family autoregulator-binding transcription factor [Streptomyces bambusae]MCB5165709.1 TetR/AcrR family transcriptional regulator [Streptomyces bambusae]